MHPIRDRLSRRLLTATAVLAATGGLALAAPTSASAHGTDHGRGTDHGHEQRHDGHGQRHDGLRINQVNLVSDLADVGAAAVDPDLVNPWGLALGPTTPLWSANAGSDTATLYSSAPGATTATTVPTVRVTFADKPELPTGQVFNGTTGFVLSKTATSAPARFIFSTITGHIAAWSNVVDPAQGNAETKATVAGASYTGLALATASTGPQLYAANFGQGRIDVFDASFAQVATTKHQFTDRNLPKGYSPFGIATLNGNIYVSYAKVDPRTHRNAAGVGLGFVDEYSVDGRLLGRIASRDSLNAPWGMEIAPASWGDLAGKLLVGNFGDGRINVIATAKSYHHNEIEGQLRNAKTGRPLVIPGLWSLLRGTDTTGGSDSIWFSAGIGNEQHGLIGVLRKP